MEAQWEAVDAQIEERRKAYFKSINKPIKSKNHKKARKGKKDKRNKKSKSEVHTPTKAAPKWEKPEKQNAWK